MKNNFIQGLRDGMPIMAGYFAVSFSFGIMAVKGGLSVFQAAFISMTNMTVQVSLQGCRSLLPEEL